jgi:hypothetical protein
MILNEEQENDVKVVLLKLCMNLNEFYWVFEEGG